MKDRGGEVGSFHHPSGGIMVRLSLGEECPKCKYINLIPLPVVKKKSDFFLFGDEASRDLSATSKLFTYSLIGASKPIMLQVEEKLGQIKSKFLPLPPTSWKIHMKELWSGSNRKKNEQFRDVTLNQVQELLNNIGTLFQEFENRIYKTNVLLAADLKDQKQRRPFDKLIKEESYILMCMTTIDVITSQGGEPIFIFDAEKDSEADRVIQQWASKAFSKGCSNILYCFMSYSIPVREPIFVKPASKPMLELADVLSFAVARHNQKTISGQDSDIDCAMFGDVNYYTFIEQGQTLIQQSSTGYPWNLSL